MEVSGAMVCRAPSLFGSRYSRAAMAVGSVELVTRAALVSLTTTLLIVQVAGDIRWTQKALNCPAAAGVVVAGALMSTLKVLSAAALAALLLVSVIWPA